MTVKMKVIRILLGVAVFIGGAGRVWAETPASATPLAIEGSEPFVFRTLEATELRLHVVYPNDWSEEDHRPCLITFFSGGWSSGTPERSLKWAKWAAELGFVGIAPDYRTRERFGGTPEDCVSDAQAAFRWTRDNADRLGIDPEKLVVQGSSAGGHLAAWTAISGPMLESDLYSEGVAPAGLILVCPVTDTKETGYGGPKRFGGDARRAKESSVLDNLPEVMPPAIVFHATGDPTVPYANSVAFRDQMIASGNQCRLVTFEGLGHAYFARSQFGEKGAVADRKTYEESKAFLVELGLIKENRTNR